jgi:hypothetical protein
MASRRRPNHSYYAGRLRADDDVDCATCKDMLYRCKICLSIKDECKCTGGFIAEPCPHCNDGSPRPNERLG